MGFSAANCAFAVISLVAAVIYSGQSMFFIQKLSEVVNWKLGCNPLPKIENLTLHYFHCQGRAEAIRLLLVDQNISYIETNYTTQTWPTVKLRGIEAGLFTFGQVPAIVTNKGIHLAQSKVILHFIGRTQGLDCDCADLSHCDVIAEGVDDLVRQKDGIWYNQSATLDTTLLKHYFLNVTLATWFTYFENVFSSASQYVVGDRITWLDYLVFDMVNSHCELIQYFNEKAKEDFTLPTCRTFLERFHKINAFYTYFKNRTRIALYLNDSTRSKTCFLLE